MISLFLQIKVLISNFSDWLSQINVEKALIFGFISLIFLPALISAFVKLLKGKVDIIVEKFNYKLGETIKGNINVLAKKDLIAGIPQKK